MSPIRHVDVRGAARAIRCDCRDARAYLAANRDKLLGVLAVGRVGLPALGALPAVQHRAFAQYYSQRKRS